MKLSRALSFYHGWLLWAFLYPFFISEASGQSEAFDFVKIGVSYDHIAKTNSEFSDLWEGDKSLSLEISTPFYLGDLSSGMQATSFGARNSQQPDFNSFYLYLGWGKALKLHRKLSLNTSLILGSNFMAIKLEDHTQKEQEVSYGASAVLSYNISSRLNVDLRSAFRKVLTNQPIRMTYFSGGLSYVVNVGPKLKQFLY